MTELVGLIAKFGLPTVCAAALLYILLRGDLQVSTTTATAQTVIPVIPFFAENGVN